jgi:hypothetical protein
VYINGKGEKSWKATVHNRRKQDTLGFPAQQQSELSAQTALSWLLKNA